MINLGSNERQIGVNVEELFELIRSHKVTIIDVRMPWELKQEGKIAESINIPGEKVARLELLGCVKIL